MTFPLQALNKTKFTQKELESSDTLIIASIFDKQTFTKNIEGNNVTLEEHRFLGSVSIPL